jgi:hypothetical protein
MVARNQALYQSKEGSDRKVRKLEDRIKIFEEYVLMLEDALIVLQPSEKIKI